MITIDTNYTVNESVGFSDTLKLFDNYLKDIFTKIPNFTATFGIIANTYRMEGDLRYEYNPFKNLKLNSDLYDSNNKLIKKSGELIDFTTDKLKFDLNHPLQIEPQQSYDGSVNLIITDDKNTPLIVNSRFTPKEDDRYVVIDRKGNSDTNVYDEDLLESQLSLYKTSDKISKFEFTGLENGGSCVSGNYNFYFKYSDADGNETDIVIESGSIPCYVGNINDPFSIRGGISDEITDKIIKFKIIDIDSSYEYLNIYYTRSTGDERKTPLNKAYKIISKFPINKKNIKNGAFDISISGYEDVLEIDISEINVEYNIIDSAKTMTQCQNRLFIANTTQEEIPVKELTDLSLRIYPFASQNISIGNVKSDYTDDSGLKNNYEYYNAFNVYNYLGYWNKELYRFGIVFIMNNNSLSNVFDVRGINNMPLIEDNDDLNKLKLTYTYSPLYKDGKRIYLEESDRYLLSGGKIDRFENVKGVSRINTTKSQIQDNGTYPIGINFMIEKEIVAEISKYAKGFFFVRQKRIPTILAQGFTIGLDVESHLPSIIGMTSFDSSPNYIYERFTDKLNILTHDFYDRLYKVPLYDGQVTDGGAMICPDAALNFEFFNNLFTGTEFVVSKSTHDLSLYKGYKCLVNKDTQRQNFVPTGYTNISSSYYDVYNENIKLTNVDDAVAMRSSGTGKFSARAGIAEEAFRYAFIGREDRSSSALNIVRGNFSSYVGVENYNKSSDFIDIHTQGYSLSNIGEYIFMRASSSYPFFAISNRYNVSELLKENKDIYNFVEYRGDCFIGNYTTRIIRNFQDPEVKINDTIIDFSTWKKNYRGLTPQGNLDEKNIQKINRSDLNAVKIGHWATLKFCSNINLCYRVADQTNVLEYATCGKPRSFYPLSPLSVTGESKIPDSYTFNVGYNSALSKKEHVPKFDVPYTKNIFDNRILYSDLHISDEFKNGYRIFKGLNYQDYNFNYGSITKILEWFDNIVVVFERAVCLMPVNERTISGEGDGGEIAVYNYGVLGKKLMPISNNYGSTWKDSVIQTNNYIYGVDAIAKKIWRTDGKGMELISDFKVQKFLNDNISLTEREITPSLALRNISTHYNSYKQDVMFTFYDLTRNNEEMSWNLCFNEKLSKWITRYDWIPLSSNSISNIYFSYDRNSAKNVAMLAYSNKINNSSEGVVFNSIELSSISESKEMSLKFINTTDETLNHYNKYYNVEYHLTNPDDADYDLSNYDNNLFSVSDNILSFTGSKLDKFVYTLKIFVILKTKSGSIYSTFTDTVSLRPSLNAFNGDKNAYNDFYTSRFWKHGQAGIFDWAEEVLPCKWYGKDHDFEFEFVVSENGQFHKIYDNLRIISNFAEPDSIEISIFGDAFYDFKQHYDTVKNVTYVSKNLDESLITTYNKKNGFKLYQKLKNIKKVGRVKSNMEYKEDYWNIEIKPLNLPIKSSCNKTPVKNQIIVDSSSIKQGKARDKYAKIRIRYKGNDRAIINQIQTMYTQSYS